MNGKMLKIIIVWLMLTLLSIVGLVTTGAGVFVVVLVALIVAALGRAVYYMHNYMKNLDTSSDFKIKAQTSFVRLSTADAEGYIEKAKSSEVKECCRKVQQALRYADPMSTDTLEQIESQITSSMFSLGEAVDSDDVEQVRLISEKVVSLIGDRERLCRAVK